MNGLMLGCKIRDFYLFLVSFEKKNMEGYLAVFFTYRCMNPSLDYKLK